MLLLANIYREEVEGARFQAELAHHAFLSIKGQFSGVTSHGQSAGEAYCRTGPAMDAQILAYLFVDGFALHILLPDVLHTFLKHFSRRCHLHYKVPYLSGRDIGLYNVDHDVVFLDQVICYRLTRRIRRECQHKSSACHDFWFLSDSYLQFIQSCRLREQRHRLGEEEASFGDLFFKQVSYLPRHLYT
jgi:hypothetical protein